MKKWVYVLSFLLISTSLHAEQEHIKLINRFNAAFAKELKKEKSMCLFGYGGRMMFDVEEVFMSYQVTQCVSMEEARRLFVEISEKYLVRINGDEKLRPFLHNYPFTINNLDLNLGFKDAKRQFQKGLAFVMYSKRTGHIVYNSYNSETDMLDTIYEEPYEEAVRLVKQAPLH